MTSGTAFLDHKVIQTGIKKGHTKLSRFDPRIDQHKKFCYDRRVRISIANTKTDVSEDFTLATG